VNSNTLAPPPSPPLLINSRAPPSPPSERLCIHSSVHFFFSPGRFETAALLVGPLLPSLSQSFLSESFLFTSHFEPSSHPTFSSSHSSISPLLKTGGRALPPHSILFVFTTFFSALHPLRPIFPCPSPHAPLDQKLMSPEPSPPIRDFFQRALLTLSPLLPSPPPHVDLPFFFPASTSFFTSHVDFVPFFVRL